MTSSKPTFGELEGRVLTLHGAGETDAALQVAHQAAAAYPDRVAFTAFWVACIKGIAGEPAEALAALAGAAERSDVWWGRELLEEDPDLRAARTVPGFAELVDECERRGAAAQSAARVEWETIEPPASADPRAAVLMALHGRTGNLDDLRDRWSVAAGRGLRVVIVQSSQMLAQGMHCWDDVDAAERDVSEVVRASCTSGDRIVLCGFSQGGALATRMALAGTAKQARGFIAIAPGFLRGGVTPEDLVPFVPAASARGVRGWMAVGELDDRYGPPGEEVARVLGDAGLHVEVLRMTGRGHEYPEPFGDVLDDAVARVLA